MAGDGDAVNENVFNFSGRGFDVSVFDEAKCEQQKSLTSRITSRINTTNIHPVLHNMSKRFYRAYHTQCHRQPSLCFATLLCVSSRATTLQLIHLLRRSMEDSSLPFSILKKISPLPTTCFVPPFVFVNHLTDAIDLEVLSLLCVCCRRLLF